MHGSLQRRLRWRRNWVYPTAGALVVALLIGGLGAWTVIPYVSEQRHSGAVERTIGRNVDNDVDILDDNIVHKIDVDVTDADYEAMIADYKVDGLKEFYPATVTIDGKRLERVGLRLKGNSTLFGLVIGEQMRKLFAKAAAEAQTPAAQKPGAAPGKPFRIGRPLPEALLAKMGAAIPTPAEVDKLALPYLFQFDEFLPGQRYQGLRQLALRGGGPTADISLQPEIVTSKLLLDVGQATTRQAYTGLSFNGDREKLFLVSEVPDDELAARTFGGHDGILFKAQTGAPFRYLGPDQTDYADWYEADSAVKRHDLAPLIGFIRWVEETPAPEFEAGGRRLDLESFADYLAVHNLLANADSLGGIGNNYYFWYDLTKRRFTPVSWDVNGSLGRITLGAEPATYDPYYREKLSFGPMAGQPKFTKNGAMKLDFAERPGFSVMKRLQPPGGELGENLLRQRFFKVPRFKALYDAAYGRLYDRLLQSGHAAAELQRYTDVVNAALGDRPTLIDANAFRLLAESNQQFLVDRRDTLAGMEPISARQ